MGSHRFESDDDPQAIPPAGRFRASFSDHTPVFVRALGVSCSGWVPAEPLESGARAYRQAISPPAPVRPSLTDPVSAVPDLPVQATARRHRRSVSPKAKTKPAAEKAGGLRYLEWWILP